MSNHFTIFAHGDNFDVDAYLKGTSLEFDHIWHRGDPRGCPEFIQDRHSTSGVEKVLGDGRGLDIREQDRIATSFLEKHEQALTELSRFPGVDYFILGLHYRIDLPPELRGFCMSASARLMHFALRTGIEQIFYVELVPSEDCGEERGSES
ncbi:MAG: hypothetical protein ABSG53_24460 [Thermoguttaceae bacterium]|jgi:hypothetical protein